MLFMRGLSLTRRVPRAVSPPPNFRVKLAGWIGFLCRGFSIPQNFGKSFTMKSPRIYTYKVTFEEVPYWYWGVHKERKYGESYLGSPVTHRWMWEFYTPKVQILEFFEDWEEALRIEKRLIEPDLNNHQCLNEHCGGYLSLESCKKGGSKAVELSLGAFGRTAEEWAEDSRKGARKAKELGVGIHAPGVSSKAGKKGAETNRENGTGLNDPRVREKALEKQRKIVELTCSETGETFCFPSIREAAKVLNLDRRNLTSTCTGKQRTTRGYFARFV